MNRNLISSSSNPVEVAFAWSRRIILLAAIVIIVSTLYPFKFTLTGTSPITAIVQNFRSQSSLLDVTANIILFMPFGFGLGSAFAQRNRHFLAKLLMVTTLSLAFSLTIETAQVFLPGRQPTPLDVISNTTGGAVGFLIFHGLGLFIYSKADLVWQQVRRLLAKVSLKYLVAVLGIYLVLASWFVFSWQGSSLKGWYDGFPLTIGNNYTFYHPRLEQEVNGAWDGSVADVVVRDRALSRDQVAAFFAHIQTFPPQDESVVAAYSLRGETGGQDQAGKSPDLVWQGTPAEMSIHQGASLAADHWLQTADPLQFATRRIRQTSQLTLSALVAPHEIPVVVPYFQQIISIATPNGMGNVMLAQVGSHLNLILSLRRINRSNQFNRQSIPDIFEDLSPHRLVVTYSGFVTRIYVDTVERAYVIDMTPNRFQIMLYLLVLVPLACLIALVADRIRHNPWLYLLVVGAGTVLPALALEGFLASEGDRNIRLANLLMGILILGGTLLIVKGSFKLPQRLLASSH
jgi:glycopeptide antibiotics resistance protein